MMTNPRSPAVERWRMFIAAWPDDDALDALAPLDRWLNRHRTHRVIPREQRHLTLAFLGDMESSMVATLAHAISEAIRAHAPVAAPFACVIGIPSARKPRVVAAALHPKAALLALMNDVLLATAAVAPAEPVLRDLERERKPHITLARTRRSEKARLLDLSAAPPIAGTMRVASICIVRSHLTTHGPQYEVVRTLEIGAA